MSTSPYSTPPQKLVSQLLTEDADLRDIVEEFVNGLPGRIEDLRKTYENLDWTQLKTLAHQLKGAGGSYGYPDLSQLAAIMERDFVAQRAEDITTRLRQLEELVTAIQAGLRQS